MTKNPNNEKKNAKIAMDDDDGDVDAATAMTAERDENKTMEEEDEDTATDKKDLPPPRLVIERMQLENFKSYAGVQTIGPFHKCLSAVVGPNGSGKSNVIDALLFVFGKRAKQLRLKKVGELIHKSSSSSSCTNSGHHLRSYEYARVDVFFRQIVDTGPGDEDYMVVSNSDTIVSRIAHRDNSSKYQINNRTVQFKDVATYLQSHGIDLDNNRFLILQGEVEMISMMPPIGRNGNDDGLLEYLEDIIGSQKFVAATTAAAEQVERLGELRLEKLHRVQNVEREKESLVAAKLEAESLLSKDRMIRHQQNILYQMYQHEATMEVQTLHDQQVATAHQLQTERTKYATETARIALLEQSYETEKNQYDRIHQELLQTKEEFNAYERRDIKLREQVKHIKNRANQLTKKVSDLTDKVATSRTKVAEATANIPKLEQEIVRLTNLSTTQDGALQDMQEQVRTTTVGLRTQLETAARAVMPLSQSRNISIARYETVAAQIDLLQQAPHQARTAHEQAVSELNGLDAVEQEKRHQLVTTKQALVTATARLDTITRTEGPHAARDETKLVDRRTQEMLKLEELKSAVATAHDEGPRRSSKPVQAILTAAQKGGELEAAGILGRLGDLATIADEYDVAVSTACGSLDYIVVKTTSGANQCLDFLRRHNSGRASFICLDKLSKGAHDRCVETPENAPRLLDLIRPVHPNLLPAFFLAVGNTLVADDLDTAARWCYDFGPKRWRVVTRDGKLLETSGTQSGGGGAAFQKKGGMKLESGVSHMDMDGDDKEAAIQQLQELCDNLTKELTECRKRRKDLADEARALKTTIRELEAQVPKLTLEIAGCDTTREELTRLLPTLEAQTRLSRDDEEKLQGLCGELERCQVDMTACTEAAAGLEGEVAALQKQIMEAGGSELKEQQAACKKTLAALNAAEKALNSAKVSISSNEKAIIKAEDAKDKAEAELETIGDEEQSFKDELTSLESDALRVQEAFERVKELEAAANRKMNEASNECEALKSTLSNAKYVEVELLAALEDLDKSISQAEAKKLKWSGDLEKLIVAAKEDFDEWADDSDESDDSDDDKTVGEDGDSTDNDASMTGGEDDAEAISIAANGPAAAAAAATKSVKPVKARKPVLPIFDSDELNGFDKDNIKHEIAVLEGERNKIAKNANMGAIAEYRKKKTDYLARIAELDDVTNQRDQARDQHEDLRRQRLEMFMDGFSQITLNLKEMYQMITLGGDAELELVDSLDPFSEGIIFSVRPPKKSWKNISNLSGGEKTLSSLALVFALHHFKPTPLYVMDEIDAALDFKNVSIVANYIKERTRNAQFIIISLRNNMFELADRLVGIYKTNNCTKSVSVNPDAFVHHDHNDKAARLLSMRLVNDSTPIATTPGRNSNAATGLSALTAT